MTKQRAATLMVMGTSSSAGKSLITAALCRCFARRGRKVAPFKAQNMSNNAAVCRDGGEIGRSQALQAFAAYTEPSTDMNPILLKPEGNTHSQVIVNGRAEPNSRGRSTEASDYFRKRQELWPHVTSALDRLRDAYELVIIEGAGSPAELNLRHAELVNMSVAKYCQSPVILIGDIERGGVFAQLLGTLWLLEPEERHLIRGLLVNKFRGDMRLFDEGVKILETRGEIPVVGVLPWIDQLHLPEEDAVALANWNILHSATHPSQKINIDVIQFPHIANFDDFDPLAYDSRVRLRYVRERNQLESTGNPSSQQPDVIILPGTKNTQADLEWLRRSGLADWIHQSHANSKTQIVGICGGYQMLGQAIRNQNHLEGGADRSQGLGLLDIETDFCETKQTCQVQAKILNDRFLRGSLGMNLSGYEIHVGQSRTHSPWLQRTHVEGRLASEQTLDGATSDDCRVWGCYLHGLFSNDAFRDLWLCSLETSRNDCSQPAPKSQLTMEQQIDRSLDRLADIVELHVDFRMIENMIESFQEQEAI